MKDKKRKYIGRGISGFSICFIEDRNPINFVTESDKDMTIWVDALTSLADLKNVPHSANFMVNIFFTRFNDKTLDYQVRRLAFETRVSNK